MVRRPGPLLTLMLGLAVLAGPRPAAAQPATAGDRLIARTAEQMLAQALARARAGGLDGLASLTIAFHLSDRVPPGDARRGLLALAGGTGDVADQARWLAAALDPDPTARPPGLLRNLAILGPFRDHGGGLGRKEGPEQPGQVWGDPRARYDWGANQVRWRAVPEGAVSARGLPLDLMIAPRKESCTYLASRVRLPAAQTFVVQLASSGSARLMWDGVEAARGDDLHAGLVFDRLATRIEAPAGDHLLAVKVCAGAVDDAGRVRLRAQDLQGRPLELISTADLAGALPGTPASKLQPVTTGLARALALPAGAAAATLPPARGLAAALVRRLGAADDLRSPRAAGLLDGVASTPQVPPDVLALAGWVAPFGPQRSGWLGLALDRARAAGDLDTVSFCQRALAQARTGAGFADWAIATASAPPLASEDDPQARRLRVIARATLGTEGIRRASLAELVSLAQQEGERAPAELWGHVAWQARELDPPLFLQATDALAARLPERYDRDYIAARARVGQAAVLAAVQTAQDAGALTSAERLLAAGESLERAGLRGRAAELYQRATALSPNRAPLFSALARVLYLGQDRAGGDRALARARALAPGDVRTRAEESLRGSARPAAAPAAPSPTPGPAVSHNAPVPAGLLVEPAVFLARKAAAPARRGEVMSRILHQLYMESLQADGRVMRLYHFAHEVVVEPRTQAELQSSLGVEGTSEILRAVVHRPDGTVDPALEQRVEGGRARLRWRELKTGDVAEVALRGWSDRPVGERGDYPYMGFVPAGGSTTQPTLHEEVVLEFPVDAPLAHDLLRGKPDRTSDQTGNGRRTLRFVWDNPPNMADEPLAPAATEVLPTVVWSLYPSWEHFLRWFREATSGFFEPDEQVRRLAQELTAGKTTRDEKVRALFSYVADRVRYVNYASAERWLPNRPQQVLARRQGDCDDKSTLLISLLKACGIEAQLVFVQPRDSHPYPSLLAARRAAIPYFGHAISMLPAKDGQPALWLNPTSPHSRPGRLHSNESGVPAVVVTAQGALQTRTPTPAPEEHGREARWRVTLDATGAGTLAADERHRGDSAFWLRDKLGEPETRAQTVESEVLASWWPSVGVDRQVEFDPNPGDGDAHLKYRARSDAFAQREGQALVFRLSPASTLASRLAPLTRRTLPVVLPVYGEGGAPSRDTREIEVQAPPGYRLAALPRTGSEPGGAFGEAQLEATRRDDRTVVVRRTLIFKATTVPPEQYASWRSWLSRVDSLMHQSVRFVSTRAKAPTVAGR